MPRKALAILVAATFMAGCNDSNVARSMEAVTPIPSRETVSISAEDLAVSMIQSGFSREEILAFGPDIRNALATYGGAEVRRGDNVSAVFSVLDGSLFVVTQRGGTYVHDLPA